LIEPLLLTNIDEDIDQVMMHIKGAVEPLLFLDYEKNSGLDIEVNDCRQKGYKSS
jgi:hypothetical protein